MTDSTTAALAAFSVTASLPFFAYGAWLVLSADVVTWRRLVRHLRVVLVGLLLTTVPLLTWMLPRFPDQFGGFAALHAFFGVQAYALLGFALTGIVPIFRAKRKHDLYGEHAGDLHLSDLHEDVDDWRFRLRVGVFGFLLLWVAAWILGLLRFLSRYVL